MSRVETAGATHTGIVRKANEDVFALHEDIGAVIVADGVGGAACGELAAHLTCMVAGDYLRGAGTSDPEAAIRDAVVAADHAVRRAAAESTECGGMKSTVVMLRWTGPRFWIANVGDSRAYRYRYGVLTQVSHDHTVSAELEEQHGWSHELARQVAMGRGLTMAIGGSKEAVPRMYYEVFEPGDIFLLCSDGLHGPVSEEAITAILASGEPLDKMADRLIQSALDAGGPDNITAALVRYTDED